MLGPRCLAQMGGGKGAGTVGGLWSGLLALGHSRSARECRDLPGVWLLLVLWLMSSFTCNALRPYGMTNLLQSNCIYEASGVMSQFFV